MFGVTGLTPSRVVAQHRQPAVSLFVTFQSQGGVQTAGAQGRTQVCLEAGGENRDGECSKRKHWQSEYDHPGKHLI